MKRRTLLVALVAGIVGVGFALPYLVYATDYAGEYEVDVTFNVLSPEMYEVDVTEVNTESSPMNTMSFWDVLLKGSPGEGYYMNFTAFVTLNQSGVISTQSQAIIVPSYIVYGPDAEPARMTFKFFEMQPGETTVRIYVQHTYLETIAFDNTWTVMVG